MFSGIIGQDQVKERLGILIEDAKAQKTKLPDLFFAGPGGTGKSTLARIVAKNYSSGNFAELNATSVKTMEDLLSHLYDNCNVTMEKDKKDFTKLILPSVVIFIDEAHEIKEPLVTELLNAMDEQRCTTFKTRKKEIFKADFKNVTFVMATTNKNDLPSPLLTRFQIFELSSYTPEQIAQSVQLRTNWDMPICLEVGKRAKAIMRIAINDIPNIQSFLRVKKLEATVENVKAYYERLKGVDGIGLDIVDYSILKALSDSSKALGIKNISNRLSRPENEVEAALGYMASIGLIEKASVGQVITEKGRNHLALKV
jgi:Holliday junction DNA helicase RuvB